MAFATQLSVITAKDKRFMREQHIKKRMRRDEDDRCLMGKKKQN